MAGGEMIMDIKMFKGIDQSEGDVNRDIRTSPDMSNFIIVRGQMQTAPGATAWADALPVTPESTATIMEAAFHGEDGATEYRIIAGAGGKLFRLNEDGSWTLLGEGYASDRWDMVNYRKNAEEWHIVTNGVDPVMYGTKGGGRYQPIEGVPAAGRYITLSDERLWLGGVDSEPTRVYWSWDNNPNNWTVDMEHPEQGGGFIDVRTYDGTRVIGLKALLNDIVIFKERSLHRMVGSYPGEFELVEVYGNTGPISEDTIVSTGGSVYFLCGEGLCVYNGMTVESVALSKGDTRLQGIAERINRAAAHMAASVIYRGTMYIALPLDGSTVNNAVIVFDMTEGIYTLIEDYRVDSWLIHHEGERDTLLFIRGNRLMKMEGDTNAGAPIDAHWLSPWFDADTKSARKTSGRVYMAIEARSLTEGVNPCIRLTMESEKKKREKIIEIKKRGLNVIRPRVKLRGRVLRMGIETVDGARLTIRQGIQIRVESDED